MQPNRKKIDVITVKEDRKPLIPISFYSGIEDPGNKLMREQLEICSFSVINKWISPASLQFISTNRDCVIHALQRFLSRRFIPELKPGIRRGYTKFDKAYSVFLEAVFEIACHAEDTYKIKGIKLDRWNVFDETLNLLNGYGLFTVTGMIYLDISRAKTKNHSKKILNKIISRVAAFEYPEQDESNIFAKLVSHAIYESERYRSTDSQRYFKRRYWTPLITSWRESINQGIACMDFVVTEDGINYRSTGGMGRGRNRLPIQSWELELAKKISEA